MNKDVILIICALVTVGAVAFAVSIFEKQGKMGKSLEEERYGRMVAEESSQKSAAKLAVLENQMKTADERVSKLKGILDQEKGVNADLKAQYDKLVQAKADLEDKFKAALESKAAAEQAAVAPAAQTAAAAPAPAAVAAASAGAQ